MNTLKGNTMFGHIRRHGLRMLMGMLALFILFSLVVMLLWNTIMPGLLGTGCLNYLQAAGLLLLCRILFGGLGSGFWGRGMREHFHTMNPEQREALVRRMHERFPGHTGHKDSCNSYGWSESRRTREQSDGHRKHASHNGE